MNNLKFKVTLVNTKMRTGKESEIIKADFYEEKGNMVIFYNKNFLERLEKVKSFSIFNVFSVEEV